MISDVIENLLSEMMMHGPKLPKGDYKTKVIKQFEICQSHQLGLVLWGSLERGMGDQRQLQEEGYSLKTRDGDSWSQ